MICNHFDFRGCGYTVDGACSSSLLAISHACDALVTGELGYALAGGVDISLGPFEMVGFAKAQAMSHGDIMPFSQHAAGILLGGRGRQRATRGAPASAPWASAAPTRT